MGIDFFAFLLLHAQFILSQCPGFAKQGYVGDYYYSKGGDLFCAVSCDNANGYHATDLGPELDRTFSYHTVYKKSPHSDWTPLFDGTAAGLNCQFGCYTADLTGPPYFLEVVHKYVLTADPAVKFYQVVVKCESGYFLESGPDSDNAQLKLTMNCTRTHLGSVDTYAWSDGYLAKLQCVPGCDPLYQSIAYHQNGFGAKTTYTQLGDSAKVSGMDSMCDTLNGYFPVNKKTAQTECGPDGEFKSPDFFFFCEQSCRFDAKARLKFAKKHLRLDCKNPEPGDWYGKCGIECLPNYTVTKRGRMGRRDVAVCRRGEFTFQATSMECEEVCTKFPDSCSYPYKCIGENQYGETFCSPKSVKYYPPEDI